MANIISFGGHTPSIHKNSFVALSADIIGEVSIGECANIWNNVTIRGDLHYIRIGKYVNVQDGSVLHVNLRKADQPDHGAVIVGDYVTIGHGAILHACTLEDACLIGMGAIVLDYAVIGKGAIIGAGAVVTPNTVIPPYSMVFGTPGKVVKTLPEESLNDRLMHAKYYWELAQQYS